MIYGIGTDLLEISRIQRIFNKYGDNFPQKILNTEELADFCVSIHKPSFLSKRFAAKEAIAKALGTGFHGFWFSDISVSHDVIGKPIVKLHREAKKIADASKINQWHLSISDEKTHVIAFAIANCISE